MLFGSKPVIQGQVHDFFSSRESRLQAVVGLALGNAWGGWEIVIVGMLTLAKKVSTVEVLLLAQRWAYNYAPTVDFE